ncbi:MAG: MutS-related protein, partial [Crocinitomicaceae bacterium]
MFNRKKNRIKTLNESFGNVKTENFNYNLISRFHKRNQEQDVIQTISDQTCNDLDFDLFFGYIDRTHSRIGQQALYHQLRTIKRRDTEFQKQETIIEALKDQELRNKVQLELEKLNNRKAYYISDLFQTEPFKKPKWSLIIPILSILAFSSIILSFVSSQFSLILMLLIPVHVLIHFALKRRVSVFIDSIPQLLIMSSVAKNLIKLNIHPTGSSIKESIKVVAAIKRRMSFFKLDQKIDSDLEAAYWFLIEMIKIIFLLEPLLLFSSAKKLENNQKDIQHVFEYVASYDIAISVLSLRSSVHDNCIPTINEHAETFVGEGMFHPLIIDCVPNDIDISEKSFLLTGSNMSGKTTLMRTVGLNALCALTLNTAFAEQLSIPLIKIYSVIRVSDDLMESTSYFMTELNLVKEIIDDQTTTMKLVLLDELFKGTNTIERIASASAVLS